MTAPQTSDTDKPLRGRRLSWAEFHRLTGREPPKAANDNIIEATPPKNASIVTRNRGIWWRVVDMRFEPDLVRELLLYVEKKATRAHDAIDHIALPGWTGEQIAYHVKLARDDGLLSCRLELEPDDEDDSVSHVSFSISGITMDGHRFLETVRDAKHWRLIKDGAAKAGNLGLATMATFASAWLKAKLKSDLGLEL